jgi:hypothetical protein
MGAFARDIAFQRDDFHTFLLVKKLLDSNSFMSSSNYYILLAHKG